MSTTSTLFLYITIAIITTTLSYLSQRVVITIDMFRTKHNILLGISFLVHWLFLAFTNISTDYYSYYRIISSISFTNHPGIELGSTLLFIILNRLFSSPDVVIFLLKTIVILLFYKCFSLIKKDVKLWVSVLAFNALTYLYAFLVIRMMFAVALVLISIVYLQRKDNVKATCILALACLMHYSAIFVLPAYIVFFLLTSSKHKVRAWIIFITLLVGAACVVNINVIYMFIYNNSTWLTEYKMYEFEQYYGTGIVLLLNYIPLLLFAARIYRNSNNTTLVNIVSVFSIYSFFVAFLGYRIAVLSRINYYFLFLYAVCIPMYLFDCQKREQTQSKHSLVSSLSNFETTVFVLYLLFRFFLTLGDLMDPSSAAGIYQYNFYWPF